MVIDDRWMDDANFRKGPAKFFERVPAPLRPFVRAMVRRKLRATLHGQGIGRHSPDEILALATRSIDAMADFLGDKPFFMGSEPTGVDARCSHLPAECFAHSSSLAPAQPRSGAAIWAVTWAA